MSLQFLIGALLGSGLFIVIGRAPARRLLAEIQQRWPRSGRKR